MADVGGPSERDPIERDPIEVARGTPSAEDMAALIALLGSRRGDPSSAPEGEGYASWRRTRLAALRRDRSAAR
jgi:hypothetical protein